MGDMMEKGYLPSEMFNGLMELNKELREANKRLRAELVSVQVENERLRMEERFLRDNVQREGLELPPEVPVQDVPLRPSTPQIDRRLTTPGEAARSSRGGSRNEMSSACSTGSGGGRER